MARRIKAKGMTLGEVGFAMKCEAAEINDDVVIVSKELWCEVAQILIDTDEKLNDVEMVLRNLRKVKERK